MEVKVEINEELFARAKEKLSASQIASALRMAMNEAATKGRTMVRRSIQDVYTLKAGLLNSPNKGLVVKKATNKDLSAEIKASNKPLSIKDANPKFSKGVAVAQSVSFIGGKARKGALIRRSTTEITVEVIKGERKPIKSAFTIARGTHAKSGQQFTTSAIFARGKRGKPGFVFGKDRMPIDSISTVSVGTAAANDRSLKKYDGPVNQYANDRFIYHIERMIKSVDGIQ